MTIKELIEILEKIDENEQVTIGVQGNESRRIGVYETECGIYIADGMFYEAIDG